MCITSCRNILLNRSPIHLRTDQKKESIQMMQTTVFILLSSFIKPSLLHLAKIVMESARMKIYFFIWALVAKTLQNVLFEIVMQMVGVVCTLYILDALAHEKARDPSIISNPNRTQKFVIELAQNCAVG